MPKSMRPSIRLLPWAMFFALPGFSGCGAEVAGTAAAVGTLQAQQVQQARATQAKVVEGLNAAQLAGATRAASAGD
jgi:hypothetical protein